jgi:hypothetical protein
MKHASLAGRIADNFGGAFPARLYGRASNARQSGKERIIQINFSFRRHFIFSPKCAANTASLSKTKVIHYIFANF